MGEKSILVRVNEAIMNFQRPVSVDEISNITGIRKSSVSIAVDKLTKSNFIKKNVKIERKKGPRECPIKRRTFYMNPPQVKNFNKFLNKNYGNV